MDRSATIAAIATAHGRGGVAVIRVSGPDAFSIAEKLTGTVPTPGKITYAKITNGKTQIIDSGVILAFKSPHSYTGEDVIEFQCHGGYVTPKRILEATIAAGARLAHRGEFTERAFLNGKLSLDQAQAVLDLIDARTSRAADAACEVLAASATADGTSTPLRALYDAALEISSTVEHALDIDEGELPDSFFTNLTASLEELKLAFKREIRALRERRLLRTGALVVLAGPPNAGKSSLMNALLKENRAIVSDIPGTTRDSIEEWLDLGGWPVRLVDTAGLRESSDQIEAEGIRRTEALLAQADIVVRLAGRCGFQPRHKDEKVSLQARQDAAPPSELVVHSKCDLLPPSARDPDALAVSAKTGEGLDALRDALIARLAQLADATDAQPTDADLVADRLALLLEADALLASATAAAGDLVLQGNLLRRICETLGAQLGVTYSTDLLTRIFSRFCVGK